MNNSMISLIFFIAVILLSIGLVVEMNNIQFTDSKTQDDCINKHSPGLNNLKEGDTCGAWDESSKICRKGKVLNSGDCEAKGNVVPLILLVLIVVSIICSIVFFFRRKTK
jgi:hypothetical protein